MDRSSRTSRRSTEQPDELTRVYKIRSDVEFWDGSALTAEDVAYSLNLHVGETESRTAYEFVSFKPGDEVVLERTTPTGGPSRLPNG